MFVDQIKERLSNGFRPFTIWLSDERKFTVSHRNFVALTPRIVVIIDDKEISHTINPMHIVSIKEATAK